MSPAMTDNHALLFVILSAPCVWHQVSFTCISALRFFPNRPGIGNERVPSDNFRYFSQVSDLPYVQIFKSGPS